MDPQTHTTAPRSPRLLGWLPYLLGGVHVAAFNLLFRWLRGHFGGGDTGEYLRIAEALRAGWPIAADNTKPLGYPLLIAAGSWLPGSPVAHALALNVVCYGLTIFLLGRVVRALGGQSWQAIVAQCLFAIIPNPAAWVNIVYTETVTMVLMTAGLLFALRIVGQPLSLWRWAALGGILGFAGIVRTEYVVMLPAASVALWAALRALEPGRRFGRLAVLWLAALPWLLNQPLLTGWRAPIGFVPPGQSAFMDVWRSGAYDMEFSQLRFHRLTEMADWSVQLTDDQLPRLHALVQALRVGADPRDPAPIAPTLLAQAEADLLTIRRLVRTEGRSLFAAYQAVAVQRLRQDPLAYARRVIRRLVWYLGMVEFDWPAFHPAHWIYSVLASPVSVVGYAMLLWLIWNPATRGPMGLVAVWSLVPLCVHSLFLYDQRYAITSLPLLSAIWSIALAQWPARRTVNRPEGASPQAAVTSRSNASAESAYS